MNSKLSMTQENESHAGLRRYQSPASPAAQTFKVQFGNANAADTATISDAVLFAVEMDPADQYAESLNLSSTTSATYLDKVTLSFTPASAGDYLLLAVADISGSGADATKVRLFDGTTSFGEEIPQNREANVYTPWAVAIQRPLTGAQTWKIQFASTDGTKTARIKNAVIAALRLDAGFAAHYYAEDLGETSTTSTSPVDKLSLSATPAAQDHLVISCGHLTNANGFHTVNAFTEEDGANFLVRDGKVATQATSVSRQWWALEKRTPTNAPHAPHAYKTRFYVQTSGTGRFRNAALALLQLSEAGGGGTQSGTGSSAGAATVSAVGQSIARASASSAGLGAASAVGRATATATASAAGAATAQGYSGNVASGTATSAGTASATATGRAIATGTFSSSGVGIASGVGRAIASATFAASGLAAANATGRAVATAPGASSGAATATAAGRAVAMAAASASGSSTATAYFGDVRTASASASGATTASGVGASLRPSFAGVIDEVNLARLDPQPLDGRIAYEPRLMMLGGELRLVMVPVEDRDMVRPRPQTFTLWDDGRTLWDVEAVPHPHTLWDFSF